ncbi:MAG: hypothetical protein R3A45_01020 [Bdellovibrionota bacterium]
MKLIVATEHYALFIKQRIAEVLKVLEMYTVIQDVDLVVQNQDVFFAVQDNKLSCTLIKTRYPDDRSRFEICRMHLGFPYVGARLCRSDSWEVPFMHQAIALNKGCYVGRDTSPDFMPEDERKPEAYKIKFGGFCNG